VISNYFQWNIITNMDASIRIKVASNKMKVTANYTPASGEGKKLTPDDVLSQLESMRINTGIKSEIISRMCESERPITSVILAEAIPPQTGEKARIETYVKINPRSKAMKKEDGSMNYYELGEICSATVSQELYRRIPPTIGKPGKDVYGDEIPGIPGRDLKIVLGHGTKRDENNPDLVIAAIEGEVLIKNGIMQISEVHTVIGDIDFSTGNIRFKGSIKIYGTVKSGFEVHGDGTIEITGNVEDAIVNGGNDVIVQGGCTGSGEGIVRAKRDVFVKFVENQRIEADRDIIINGDSYHATLLAGKSVLAKGKKGTIVGGKCEAKSYVEANIFGSVASPATIIKIGIDPKLTEKLKVIESDIVKNQDSIDQIEKSIAFIYRQKIDANGVLPPDKQVLLEKLELAQKTMPDKLKALINEKENLLKEQKYINKAYAFAYKGVFPKVQVHIGNQWITIEDNLGSSKFKLIESEIARFSN